MSTTYPSKIDTGTSVPIAIDKVTKQDASTFNALRSAIVAVETELGIGPKGVNSSVASRLAAIEANVGAGSYIETVDVTSLGPIRLTESQANADVIVFGGIPVSNSTVLFPLVGDGYSTKTDGKRILFINMSGKEVNISDSWGNALDAWFGSVFEAIWWPTNGLLAPIFYSLPMALEVVSNTQGAILTRGSNYWIVLSPPTSGAPQVLSHSGVSNSDIFWGSTKLLNVTNPLITATYNIQPSDYYIGVGTLTGSIVINLPSSPLSGTVYEVKDVVGEASIHTIAISASPHLIDGASTYVLNANFQHAKVVFTGTNWSLS